MSRRRASWAGVFVMLHLIFMCSALKLNFKKFSLSWHGLDPVSAAYESAIIGVAAGAVSVAVALTFAVPATLVSVITVVVLLAFSGKPLESLVVEARKVMKEIAGHVGGALLKEGNAVAAVFAVLGYFALVKRSSES